MSTELAEEIKKIIKGDVETNEETLRKYGHDASIFEVFPEAVVFPKDERDVEEIIKFVDKNKKKFPKLSVTARAGGTDMSGGPINESIILEFDRYFNKIKWSEKKLICAQTGVYYRDFEKETMKKNLLLPSYPASKSICGIGGMVANNSGGEKTLMYGKTEDYVLELKVVLSDGKTYKFKKLTKEELRRKMLQNNFEGKIYRKIYHLLEKNFQTIQKAKPDVAKNSAGYYLWNVWDRKNFDLTQLFVGSQGTLGIITEAKFKLIEKKKHSRLIVCSLKDVVSLSKFVNVVLPFNPTSLETFDDATLKLALKFMPEIAKKTDKSFFSMIFSFWREAIMVLRHGFPKFVVLVELEEEDGKVLAERIGELDNEFSRKNIPHIVMKSEKDGEKYWTIRRESFNLLRNKIKDKKATAFIDDFVIQPSKLPEFIPKLDKILKKHDISPTYAGHAGSGNFHVIPLMDLTKESERKKIHEVSEEVYELISKYHGSITAEHNDGLIRSPYLEKMYDKNIIKLFEKTKEIFDPKNLFNPGKKVNSNINYALSHIRNFSEK